MREILFRGMNKVTSQWIEGDLFHQGEQRFISENNRVAEVIPETIGQYTGLTDKNGKKIFEGDILIYVDDGEYDPDEKYLVVWDTDEAAFRVKYYINGEYLSCECITPHQHFEVIGNIYDNSELLEGDSQ